MGTEEFIYHANIFRYSCILCCFLDLTVTTKLTSKSMEFRLVALVPCAHTSNSFVHLGDATIL
jgi:hypothetical protein